MLDQNSAASPLKHLQNMLRAYPNLSAMVDQFRTGEIAWPDWCLLPMNYWHEIAIDGPAQGDSRKAFLDAMGLASIGTWQYTQGVYVLDQRLRAALELSDIPDAIPIDVFTQMPEWSVYVATPGMTLTKKRLLVGFWAHLDWDGEGGEPVLRLYLNVDGDNGHQHLLGIAVEASLIEFTQNIDRMFGPAGAGGQTSSPSGARDVTTLIKSAISILLYLCTEGANIRGVDGEILRPPTPENTSHLTVPPQPTVWHVGAHADRGNAQDRLNRGQMERGQWRVTETSLDPSSLGYQLEWVPPIIGRANPD